MNGSAITEKVAIAAPTNTTTRFRFVTARQMIIATKGKIAHTFIKPAKPKSAPPSTNDRFIVRARLARGEKMTTAPSRTKNTTHCLRTVRN